MLFYFALGFSADPLSSLTPFSALSFAMHTHKNVGLIYSDPNGGP